MQEMKLALSTLDPLKSAVPDNIHGLMISSLSDGEKQIMLENFNLLWRLGRLIPDRKKP